MSVASATALQAAIDLIDAQIAVILATAKPDYSVDGKSVSWGAHYDRLVASRDKLREMMIAEEGPSEIHVRGVT